MSTTSSKHLGAPSTTCEKALMPRTLKAWGVHLFTASGALWGLLALAAIATDQWVVALWWMLAAMVVDSFDGMLARLVGVKRLLPGFDGDLLDNILDYLNYVAVPALFLYRTDLLPPGYGFLGAGAMLLVSTYQFCQPEAKDFGFFKGFPSFWNVLVFYLFFLDFDPWINLTTTAILCGLVFVPVRWLWVSRMSKFRRLAILMTVLWGIACAAILVQDPEPAHWLILASLAYVLGYTASSVYATLRARGSFDIGGDEEPATLG